MQLYSYENFMVLFFFWSFVLLATGFLITFALFLKNRKNGGISYLPNQQIKTAAQIKKQNALNQMASGSSFADKLGEQVVRYLIEVSESDVRSLLTDRISRIKSECERLNQLNLPIENKRIISTVLLWTSKFSIDRHIRELRILRRSTQIVYDDSRKDFKLKITAD